ncbi:MAG: YmdB family metallophosphoesterase, partial [Spirochaetaceae bacterium]|nr:YmdB family metallophosphoesterase [Spirochaetaceae bacterium]
MAEKTVLMIGDVVGEAGMRALEALLPGIIARHGAAFVVVNGENAASGYGLTPPLAERIFACGADVITSGNHIWEKRDFWPFLESEPRLLRPANYPADSAGRGVATVEKDGAAYTVINLQGRKYMGAIDCPFRCFDGIYAGLMQKPPVGGPPLILVDFHAEATDEKEALGFYLDGRAACIAGTHTHIQSADEKLLPRGSAYISDLGMTGSLKSVIGMRAELCVQRFTSHIQSRLECAEENPAVQGAAVVVATETARALAITRINTPFRE